MKIRNAWLSVSAFWTFFKGFAKKQSAKQSFPIGLYHKMQRMGFSYKYQIFFRLPLSFLAFEMIDLLIASYKFCHFFYNSFTNSLKSTCTAIENQFSNTNVNIDIFMHSCTKLFQAYPVFLELQL